MNRARTVALLIYLLGIGVVKADADLDRIALLSTADLDRARALGLAQRVSERVGITNMLPAEDDRATAYRKRFAAFCSR